MPTPFAAVGALILSALTLPAKKAASIVALTRELLQGAPGVLLPKFRGWEAHGTKRKLVAIMGRRFVYPIERNTGPACSVTLNALGQEVRSCQLLWI
jgi:hypothetical protein